MPPFFIFFSSNITIRLKKSINNKKNLENTLAKTNSSSILLSSNLSNMHTYIKPSQPNAWNSDPSLLTDQTSEYNKRFRWKQFEDVSGEQKHIARKKCTVEVDLHGTRLYVTNAFTNIYVFAICYLWYKLDACRWWLINTRQSAVFMRHTYDGVKKK